MFRLINKIPKKVTIACSGGIDSMAVVNYLKEGRREIELAYFNHDTVHSRTAQFFVEEYAESNKMKLHTGRVQGIKGRRSMEEFWRDERYTFFNNLKSDFIITCHHLDDCVETWLMTSFHGEGRLIPYKREPNIYRPFLMTAKSYIKKYAEGRNLAWSEDASNMNVNFMRNHVRHNILPQVLRVNPGIRTTIRKKLINLYSRK